MVSQIDYRENISERSYYDIKKMWRVHNEGKVDAFKQKRKLIH